MTGVIAHKITSLQRCTARAREARAKGAGEFAQNFDLQDAAILNVIRACELAIDLANMMIRRRRLGIPAESRESLTILMREQLLAPQLAERLQKMVGFRNVAVHQYRELDMAILEAAIDKGHDDLLDFAEIVRKEGRQE